MGPACPAARSGGPAAGTAGGLDRRAPVAATPTGTGPAARRFDWSVAGGVEVMSGQSPGDRWQATSTVDRTGLPPTSAGRNRRAETCLVTASVTTES